MQIFWNRLRNSPTRRLVALLGILGLLEVVALPLLPGRIHLLMIWNLFLSALPLWASLSIIHRLRGGKGKALTALLCLLWLAFFPNAPYMATDLIHLSRYAYWGSTGFLPDPRAWLALLHIVTAVLAGCTSGALSLHLLHRQIRRHFGGLWGWAFVLASSLLSGVGIYLGRFFRFNSWDLATRPLSIIREVLRDLDAQAVGLYLIFSLLTLIPYLLFSCCFHPPHTSAGKG